MFNRELSQLGVMGTNSNVSVDGVVFHIQTEDLGPKFPQIVTHIFAEGGHVIKVVRFDYACHAGKPNLHLLLPKVLMAHHANIVTKVKRGALNEIDFDRSQSPSGNTEGMKPDPCKGQACIALSIPDVPNDTDAPVSTTTSDVESCDASEASDCQGIQSSSSVAPASRSAREIWDYLVAKAQCERTESDSTSSVGSAPPVNGVSCAWDRAVLALHQKK